MKDLQWVEAFHWELYFSKHLAGSVLLAKKQRSQSCRLLSKIISTAFLLDKISQYSLKPEHLTTFKRTPTHSEKKKKEKNDLDWYK